MRDINLGIYSGRLKEYFYRDFPGREKRFRARPKKGESWNDVKKRLINLFKEIDKIHKNKKILIISHGDPLWLLEGIIKNWSEKKLLKELSKKSYIETGELRKI